ncbi:hypothetical protein OA07_18805, partial [Aphanizomenon flos-aquae 2012/KM1/D3]|uniref:hypothetical protein n=1 Tax=Aphanizomenon flos-aquae TaxID=1176 RepID=UPI000543FDEB
MSMVREAIACFPEELGALFFPQEFSRGDSYGALRYRLGFPQELGAIAWVFLKNWGRSLPPRI